MSTPVCPGTAPPNRLAPLRPAGRPDARSATASFRQVLCTSLLLAGVASLPAELLYSTSFENPPFSAGPDQWVGSDGWIGNSAGSGVHGIDQGLIPGQGQTAYLGFNQPDNSLVVVARPIDHDPVAEGSASVVIDTLLGIEDSTNGFRDNFWLTVYNMQGDLLGALRFSNELATYGIWRYDGMSEEDTGLAFIHGELHLLYLQLHLQANRWSAYLDGIPLFLNAPLTATGHPRTLGSLAYEWQLTSPLVTEHGDNWMLVADSYVWAVPPGEIAFEIDRVGLDGGGSPLVEFTGDPGWSYQVEYTDDLVTWFNDLPGSGFSGLTQSMQVEFSDQTAMGPNRRWYRVERSVTP